MWYSHLDKITFLLNLYTEVPQLLNVCIEKLEIREGGDRVTLLFDMPRFPDRQPEKWVAMGYNTACVELDFFEIKEILVKSITNKFNGNITITKDKDDIITVNVTGSIEVKIKAGFGMVQSVKGYCT